MKKNNVSPFKNIVGLPAATYKNTTPVMKLSGVDFYLWDVVKASLAARLNMGLGGSSGGGKSQLFADVAGLFGNNLTYVLGRNGSDITSFYKQMKFGKLKDAMDKGGTASQKDITDITNELYRPITLVEEINRAAEIVQNQYFNIFEGFIELNGTKHALGGGGLETFKDFDDKEFTQSIRYSVGLWTANFGNGQYTGTVSMDKGLKERSHIIIDVDNFYPGSTNPSDIDDIIFSSGGEVRLKDVDSPIDNTQYFVSAYKHLKQMSFNPSVEELGMELMISRYLVLGLDYVPAPVAKNSKRIMKEVWPKKIEDDNIGLDDERTLYGSVFPASIRSTMTIISLARSLREYAKAKKPTSNPAILDSIIESFKLVAPYGGMIENPNTVREKFFGNNYLAAEDAARIIKEKLESKNDLMQAIIKVNSEGKPYTKEMLDECSGEFSCLR